MVRGLSCPMACEFLVPGPRIEPVSPALVGRVLTTGLPGNPCRLFNDGQSDWCEVVNLNK